MKAFAILPVLVGLCGCVGAAADQPDPADASCSAEGLQYLVGQPDSAFDPSGLDEPVRVIHPGDAITMDFSLQRLNVEIDAEGRIAAIRCG
ncbi:I78 family peptidase inhibitor [Defluviimonas sp. WL0050]|uniref:I78 family peptidase inhibitor n=1 Tax=Albidovulum litorale TaxID=2984134 RepID=A0ABT2ZQR0_9RHOB|nr:I78 family peptidase inhibitor [Defluviimonas sp. WL0050]MCV2873469.1 I78 family peptidase inhibitor [Defluviimonas sp. WL0050]